MAWFLFLHLGPCFASNYTGDGPITITSANVTSLRKNWGLLQSLDSTYYLCQETMLNKHGQASLRRSMHSNGYDILYGRPCQYKFSGAQKLPSLWNSKAGGLATIAAQPHRTQDIFHDNPAFELGRCSHTFVPIGIGNRGLHIFNVYGYVGAGPRNPHAFKLNEQLLHDVCQIALSLIAGDLQTAPDQSPLLGTLIQSGRLFDLGALFTESTWTFQKGDNQHIRTRTQHCPLRLVLRFHTVKDNKLVYKSPKALPNLDPPDPTFARFLDQQLWSQADNAYQHAVICNAQ